VGVASFGEGICKFDEVCAFNRRGLFLGGAAKSGTTLLLSLLDGHPKLAVLPEETHFFGRRKNFSALTNYPDKARWFLQSSDSDLHILAQGRIERARKTNGSLDTRDYTHFDYTGFVQLTEEFAKQSWLNDSLIFSEVVRAYAIANGCDWRNCVRWVEKTPGNESYSEDLFTLFPDAKFIQVVRDPRAVFSSRKKHLVRRYGHYAKAHRHVREWNESARQISKLQKRGGSYLLVRYEDLIQNTARTLEKVCQFIGIEFLPVNLEPTRAGKQWEGNSAYEKSFGGISAESVSQWKNELTKEEVWWIEMHCRTGMEIAGYQLETDCRFSLPRWFKRMPGESIGGYVRARRGSVCQWAGWLEECRYDAANQIPIGEHDSAHPDLAPDLQVK
jgi:hypothetical protein